MKAFFLNISQKAKIATVLFAMAVTAFSFSAYASLKEYQLKAAFIYNFAKFIEWPQDSTQDFKICVLGTDPFGATLNPAKTKDVKGKHIVIERKTAIDSLKNCKILFVGDSERGNLSKLFEYLGSNAVLTVSDLPSFSSKGGIIEFVEDEGRIRFKINSKLANQRDMKISAKLLELAEETN